jgi:DnaJ-domain-containing protein 1
MEDRKNCPRCNASISKPTTFCPHCGAKQPRPLSEDELHQDPFTILQISPDAEDEVIDASYRSLARKYHPDSSTIDDSSERMKEINWAYSILKDPKKRREWSQRSRPAAVNQQRQQTRSYSSSPQSTSSSPRSTTRARTSTRPSTQTTYQPTSLPNGSNFGKILLGVVGIVVVILIFSSRSTSPASSSYSSGSTSPAGYSQLPTPTPRRVPTSTIWRLPTLPSDPCLQWHQVTLRHVGKEICVTGTVRNAYETQEAFFITFSNQSEDFYLLSYEWVFEVGPGSCVVAEGLVQKLGRSPLIVIEYNDNLYKCR